MADDDMSIAEISRSLDRIEKKLDAVTGDHEQRIRRLERMVWVASGVAAAGGGVLGHLFGGHW